MSESDASRGVRGSARTAILASFRQLISGRRYEGITIGQIVGRARVARSTFYDHFVSKDELLLEGLTEPFSALARSAGEFANTQELIAVLDHFWENRAVAKSFLSGPMRRSATQLLANMIHEELGKMPNVELPIPAKLHSQYVAGGQLALILAWVSGEASCSAARLAAAIQKLSPTIAKN